MNAPLRPAQDTAKTARAVTSLGGCLISALLWLPQVAGAGGTDTDFDTEALRARGVDPSLAQFFREKPRFMPGSSSVLVAINGVRAGRLQAHFGEDGTLCASKTFMQDAGLRIPAEADSAVPCPALTRYWPQAEITADPGEGRLDIVIPQEALARRESAGQDWSHGGSAGLLNYSLQWMHSAGAGQALRYQQADTEAGFNAGDWIIRSRQSFSRMNGQDTFSHQDAYLQRTFSSLRKVLQVGQIGFSHSLFGAGQVLGLQLFPEAALSDTRTRQAVVEGTADVTSVVEVRQAGMLIYSTTVPAGPYSLPLYSLLNTRTDLDVTVTGRNGTENRFTIPAVVFAQNVPAAPPGMSLGIGRADSGPGSPGVATATWGTLLSDKHALQSGAFFSAPWQALSLMLDSPLARSTRASLQLTAARPGSGEATGLYGALSLSHAVSERLALSAGVARQSHHYRDFSEAIRPASRTADRTYTQEQQSVSLSWAQDTLGTLSLSWAESRTSEGSTRQYLRGSWGRSAGRAYLTASLEHSAGHQRRDNRAYLSLSIPFGSSRSLSTFISQAGGTSRAGARYTDRSRGETAWSLGADHDTARRQSGLTGTLDTTTAFAQTGVSVSRDTEHQTSGALRASGAMVMHRGGVTLSPWRTGETFGLARVSNEPGVRIETPSGPVWTDRRGYAVLPSLGAYRSSSVQIDTRTLGRNVDIGNAWQQTEMARGAVSQIEFGVTRTRRVLVTVRDRAHQPLPYGAAVFEGNTLVTVVTENGDVFLTDGAGDVPREVQVSGRTICTFRLTLPDVPEKPTELYETAEAICE